MPLDPTLFVIFGGAGDLAWRKLIPALYNLYIEGGLPEKFAIVAVDRNPTSDPKLRKRLGEGIKQFSGATSIKPEQWAKFAAQVFYQAGDFTAPSTYAALKTVCGQWEKKWGKTAQRIFYLATPPAMFAEIPKYLGRSGLSHDRAHARLVVEKPIGYDLESARALNTVLAANFDESQIYRIDHYLGKETVQNIMAFRFANPLFEPVWNRQYIDYVTITVGEQVGVEHRGGYYDHAGALRDMVQNHLLQLLCLVAMEPTVSFQADEIRNKKIDVLHAVRPIPPEAVNASAVRGQYGAGWIEGKAQPAYRDEEGVAPDSQTETFAALKLFVDNWRWQDVPFYLRTGKCLPRQVSEIVVQFRAVPHRSFPAEATQDWQASRIVISIQPNEGIVLTFQAKHPGPKLHLQTVDMRFSYEQAFAVRSPEAYETLLGDVMRQDQTLFMRADQVEAAWSILMPILKVWQSSTPAEFPNYAAGTWGPDSAQTLLAQPGHRWPLPEQLLKPAAKKKPSRPKKKDA